MPKMLKPASTCRPRVPGIGPIRQRPSGVYPSGPLSTVLRPASANGGTREAAWTSTLSIWSRSGGRSLPWKPSGIPSSAHVSGDGSKGPTTRPAPSCRT